MQAPIVDADQLAGLDVAYEYRADDVERARLARDDESVRKASDRQWPHPVRIAGRVHAPLVHHDEAVGPAKARQHPHRGVLEPSAHGHLVRHQRRHDVGVRRGGRAGLGDERRELVGVHEVPVVPERERVRAVGLEDRLGVVPRGGARRRVAGVPDREVALERGECGLVEDLAHEAQVLVDEDVVPLAHGDAGRLLPPVLLSEEPEVREARDVVAGRPHTEEPAFLVR